MNITVTWKKALVGVGIVAALAGGAFYAGRESRPDKVVTQTAEQFRFDLRLEDKTQTQTKTAVDTNKATKKKEKIVKVVVEKPNGEKVTTVTKETDTSTTEGTKATEETVVKNDVKIDEKIEDKKETQTTVENKTDRKWTLAVGASTDLLQLRHFKVEPTYYLTLSRHILSLGPVDFAGGLSVLSEGKIVSLENKTIIGFVEGSVDF